MWAVGAVMLSGSWVKQLELGPQLYDYAALVATVAVNWQLFVSCACSLGTAENAVQLVVGCCATFGMTRDHDGATASLHTSVSMCLTVEVYDSALSWAPGLVEYDVHLCVSVHVAAHTFWRMYDEAV